MTEVLDPADERCKTSDVTTAIRMKVEGLLEKWKFKFIFKKDVPEDGNVLLGRFIVSIKLDNENREIFKPKFVIGGLRDKLKNDGSLVANGRAVFNEIDFS